MASDWADVPEDVWSLVALRLPTIDDYVRLGAVCRSCHSATTSSAGRRSQSQHHKILPWLIFRYDAQRDAHCVYNLYTDKITKINLPDHQEDKGWRWSSSSGWLIFYDVVRGRINLLNPLSKSRLSLPTKDRLFVQLYVNKFSPSSSDWVVVGVYRSGGIFENGYGLAFAKPGDDSWLTIENNDINSFGDAILFNGKCYMVTLDCHLYECQGLDGPHPTIVEFASPESVSASGIHGKKYLVELDGALCLVNRDIVGLKPTDRGQFTIFKLDMQTRNWKKLISLDDWCIFVGINHSFSIRASDCPKCKSNCIYFTVQFEGPGFGMYDVKLEKEIAFKSFKDKFNCSPEAYSAHSIFSFPMWITPRFG